MNSYTDIRSGIDTWFKCLYTKVLRLSELVGSAEERPGVNRRGTTPAETAKEYWKRAVAIPFLDSFIGIEVPFQPRKASSL